MRWIVGIACAALIVVGGLVFLHARDPANCIGCSGCSSWYYEGDRDPTDFNPAVCAPAEDAEPWD